MPDSVLLPNTLWQQVTVVKWLLNDANTLGKYKLIFEKIAFAPSFYC